MCVCEIKRDQERSRKRERERERERERKRERHGERERDLSTMPRTERCAGFLRSRNATSTTTQSNSYQRQADNNKSSRNNQAPCSLPLLVSMKENAKERTVLDMVEKEGNAAGKLTCSQLMIYAIYKARQSETTAAGRDIKM